MKIKVLIVLLILFSMHVTVGMTIDDQKESKSSNNINNNVISFSEIITSTDKLYYDMDETVKITYLNTGKTVVGFVIGIARPVIPLIVEIETGRILFLTDPSLCYPYVMIYDVLEPGESLIIEWNQQHYGYDGDTFNSSEQAHPGHYYVELGYWEVIGYYDPPYQVPGGPPEYFSVSNIFTIG